MLEADLQSIEEEEKRRIALESQEGQISQNTKGKSDPKKDAKGKGGKGGGAEDKNAPKSLEIEYPEVESEPNYIIIERSFTSMSKKPEAKKPVSRSTLS